MTLPSEEHDVLLLHNPRCSKSRATRSLLVEKGISFVERAYLEDPLDAGELEDLSARLGVGPSAWIRKREEAYGAQGLSTDSKDAELIQAIAAAPSLMERPIVVRGKRAAIGRPPENVLELF